MAPFVPMRKGVQTFKINAQFTEKTGKAIKNTISSKAIGPDGTFPLMIKHIGHEGIRSLTSLQKLIYLDGDYPGYLQETICGGMNEPRPFSRSILTAHDLSKAFDTVSHSLLLLAP